MDKMINYMERENSRKEEMAQRQHEERMTRMDKVVDFLGVAAAAAAAQAAAATAAAAKK